GNLLLCFDERHVGFTGARACDGQCVPWAGQEVELLRTQDHGLQVAAGSLVGSCGAWSGGSITNNMPRRHWPTYSGISCQPAQDASRSATWPLPLPQAKYSDSALVSASTSDSVLGATRIKCCGQSPSATTPSA